MKEILFEKIENMIKEVEVEDFNIYNICGKGEKLQIAENKGNSISYKILKNKILLKYYEMKKISDYIEIRFLNNIILKSLKSKFENVQHKEDDLYIKISIENIEEIEKLSKEIQETFKFLFLQYMDTEEAFGCCSHYIECSNNKKCIKENVRLRLSCQYKKNLDNGRIFYGENKNI